ncbi:MAG: hypothetical protein NVSMB2_26150 [Chloroflexota bacterium]
MKVIIKEPGQPAHAATIAGGLASYQAVVAGPIEVAWQGDSMCLLVNEEGALSEMPPNVFVARLGQYVVGTLLVVGSKGARFVALTDDQVAQMVPRLSLPMFK